MEKSIAICDILTGVCERLDKLCKKCTNIADRNLNKERPHHDNRDECSYRHNGPVG